MNRFRAACVITFLLLAAACERFPGSPGVSRPANSIAGFFLLNEGSEGSNHCTLDYYDYSTGVYSKNIFPERNFDVIDELGDVGTDIGVYGTRLWVVVNHSNLVEVIDARTGWHITQISIPNCRSITFKDRHAYVSSYGCPVGIDPNAPQGYVAKIDTSSLEVIDTCHVGYQPEEMAIVGEHLYVANSGCYRVPDYDHTVSGIDLHIFREDICKIDVATNLHRMEADAHGQIWVSSRGDYYDIPPIIAVINAERNEVCDFLEEAPCSDMALCGDSLYVYGNTWNYFTQSNKINYSIVDVRTRQVVSDNFITDGTDLQIQSPNGIAVNPQTREIFITDARDGVTPGKLYCFSPEGVLKWSVNTGERPSRIVFTKYHLL